MPTLTALSLGRSFLRSVWKRLPELKSGKKVLRSLRNKMPIGSAYILGAITLFGYFLVKKSGLKISCKSVSSGIFSESRRGAAEYAYQANLSINNVSTSIYPATQTESKLFQASSAIFNGLFGHCAGIATRASLIRRMALRRQEARKGFSPLLGFFGFICVGVEAKPSPEEQFDKLHSILQETLKSKNISGKCTDAQNQSGYKLSEYKIGERLGERSCYSAVYSAMCGKTEVAIKMLFNYYTESQSNSLYQAFAKEHQILSQEPCVDHSYKLSLTSLPPHDNIVKVIHSFADSMPFLPDALENYPDALPSRLNSEGKGHNRTLFLVMPRYTSTLHQYMESSGQEISPRFSTLLLAQLLEGVAHMNEHGIAHRDLKSDNILLDERVTGCPKLVITDFGCCLADEHLGLEMPFVTYETDRGGNRALMAPEVVKALPGPDVIIDYSKSDAWAVGTLAYEIFGQENPFYLHDMDSQSYKENDLPQLVRAHPFVAKVVSLLLKINVDERISAAQAVTLINLFLWAPLSWLVDNCVKYTDIARWLTANTLEALKRKLYHQSGKTSCAVDDEIFHNFLRSTRVQDIVEALEFLQGH